MSHLLPLLTGSSLPHVTENILLRLDIASAAAARTAVVGAFKECRARVDRAMEHWHNMGCPSVEGAAGLEVVGAVKVPAYNWSWVSLLDCYHF